MEAHLNEFNKTSNKKESSKKESSKKQTTTNKNNVILKEQYCLKMIDYMVF